MTPWLQTTAYLQVALSPEQNKTLDLADMPRQNRIGYICNKKKIQAQNSEVDEVFFHTSPPRWDLGTLKVCASFLTAKPVSSRSDHNFFRASNRSSPLNHNNHHQPKLGPTCQDIALIISKNVEIIS